MLRAAVWTISMVVLSCGGPGYDFDGDTAGTTCAFPADPDTIAIDGDAVLLRWEFPDDPVFASFALPQDTAFEAYRTTLRSDGADVRIPIADEPVPATEEEAILWRDDRFNAELARRGEAGTIEPIRCLDALLFAFQNSRVAQLDQPTEFLASVLLHESDGDSRVAVIFGAGMEMYPPKSVYGFEVVDEYRSRGWRYSYALHNHTIQKNGDRLALGTPALSTSDVQLTRSLAAESDLDGARVTNGFFTYVVAAEDLTRLRSR